MSITVPSIQNAKEAGFIPASDIDKALFMRKHLRGFHMEKPEAGDVDARAMVLRQTLPDGQVREAEAGHIYLLDQARTILAFRAQDIAWWADAVRHDDRRAIVAMEAMAEVRDMVRGWKASGGRSKEVDRWFTDARGAIISYRRGAPWST